MAIYLPLLTAMLAGVSLPAASLALVTAPGPSGSSSTWRSATAA